MKHLLTLALLLCLGTFASAQIPSYVPSNGLVGWWPFNGNANDESGNGNHGTVNGATLAADRFGNAGKAYSFGDNDPSYITTTNNLSLKPSNTLSFSIWVKLTNNSNFSHMIEFRINNNNYPWHSYACGKSTSGSPGFFHGGFSFTNGDSIGLWSNNLIPLNLWMNYTVTYDGQCGKLFVNGVLEDTSCKVGNILYSPIQNPVIFGGMFGGGFSMIGLLDDIAIYNRALSAAEVQQLYLGNSSTTPAASTVPGKIHYQGLAVGTNGKPIKNGTLGLRLSVLDSQPNGSNLYTETQTASTDAAGIFSTYIGGGTATAGTFASIPWANGNNKFLKVEMDAQGGTNYQSMGTTQLVSVPYALHAGSAEISKKSYELMDSAGNAYQIKIVNGQPTLVSAPGNVSSPGAFACGQSVSYAGESYPTVQIGTQCWFQKNVNAGTMVQGANNQANNSILEKYCYNNDTANCSIYGGLYQWAEAVQYQNGASNTISPSPSFTGNVQGICPTGWHVPSDGEWCTLTTFLDATVNCSNFIWTGTDIGSKLKSISGYWISSSFVNSNISKFNAIPSGSRDYNSAFSNLGRNTYLWTSNEGSFDNGIGRDLYYNDPRIGRNNIIPKSTGWSIRCLKD